MIRYRIEMARAVGDLVRHLPPGLKERVKEALKSIAADPYRAKELRDELAGLRSHRVARARLIYRIKGFRVKISLLARALISTSAPPQSSASRWEKRKPIERAVGCARRIFQSLLVRVSDEEGTDNR